MEERIVCYAITPALSPDGERFFRVEFGIPISDIRRTQVQLNTLILWDTRAVLNFSEKEFFDWPKKFEVGKRYLITSGGDTLTIAPIDA
ncbi:MAG TPA: hypothetical protein VI874_01170 [Candidatus Norongarragalinales archaeon]|nr:hypothetical protein [Candidatus Norongarragalinales archaeon]